MKTKAQIIKILENNLNINDVIYSRDIESIADELSEIKAPEDKPTDEDIDNAGTDYVNDNYLAGRLTTVKQKVHKAYCTGAKEMRDGNIFVSPKKYQS